MVKKGERAQKINVCVVREAVSKGIGAVTIARGNGWSTSSVSKVISRIKKGPTERRAGSGVKTEYAGAKIDEIQKALAQSPQQSMAEVAHAAAVSRATARRVVKQKLKFKPLKTTKGETTYHETARKAKAMVRGAARAPRKWGLRPGARVLDRRKTF